MERKPHLVRRELVCLRRKGVWGSNVYLISIRLFFVNGIGVSQMREALCNQVIRGKYGEERGGWCYRVVREVHGVGLWKGIRMDYDFVGSRILFLIGNGRRVNFRGIDGARIPLCVCHSLLCLLCLLIKKCG